MQSRQFCYWLQGSFELNNSTEFNQAETQIIKDHLALVFIYDKSPNGFCNFLNGYFSLANPLVLNKEVTEMIKQQLRATFKNEIDPTYPEQQELNNIHNGNERGGLQAMC